jgi:hypothetical protein
LGLPSGLFPSGFPTKTLCMSLPSPIHATRPTHLIRLDFITRKLLGEEYRSLSSSLCGFLHSPVTSSLLGPKRRELFKKKRSVFQRRTNPKAIRLCEQENACSTDSHQLLCMSRLRMKLCNAQWTFGLEE